jgi:hypothetical protein
MKLADVTKHSTTDASSNASIQNCYNGAKIRYLDVEYDQNIGIIIKSIISSNCIIKLHTKLGSTTYSWRTAVRWSALSNPHLLKENNYRTIACQFTKFLAVSFHLHIFVRRPVFVAILCLSAFHFLQGVSQCSPWLQTFITTKNQKLTQNPQHCCFRHQ